MSPFPGVGISDRRGNFSELPGVKSELESIIRELDSGTGVLNGLIKIDDEFKKQIFFNVVGAGAFPIVHIASLQL